MLRLLGRRCAWVPELVVMAAVWAAYELAQRSAPLHVADAVGRGRALLVAEARAGLDVERSVNHALSAHPLLATVANYYYAVLHFGVTLVVLIWLWWRRRDRYAAARNWLVATNLAALLVFWLAPTAPPRLLPGAGFVDTVVRFHTWGSWASPQVAKSADQYASIPSLHVAWALWCAAAVAAAVRSRRGRALVWAYPVCTSVVVVVTGNHYVLDVVAGGLVAALGWALTVALAAGRARVRPYRPSNALVRRVAGAVAWAAGWALAWAVRAARRPVATLPRPLDEVRLPTAPGHRPPLEGDPVAAR